MEGKKQERYSLMGPGGGISAVSMEAGEFHLFGNSCTTIITTETDNYPVIEDEPGKLEVVDNTDLMSGIGHGIANGLLLCAGVVLFAGATAATGGAALLLGGCVLGGMSFGVSAATDGMVESDRETGNDRSWGDFALGVAGGGVAGATTGAVLYGTVMAAPVAGLAAGMDAAAVIGPSAFTTTVVPAIITGGGYGLAGATALYVENDIRARNGGYNLLLDKVFENNTDRYEECGMILMLGNNVYMEYGAMNMNRMPGGDSKESFGNNQSVQKLKDQNSMSGTIGGNAGSPVSITEKTLDMALDPETYAYVIAKKYGINLRGSGQNITIKYNPNIRPGIYGRTLGVNPYVIEIGPDALMSETELANTIAHELNHARDFIKGGHATEPPAYSAGNALSDYINGGR